MLISDKFNISFHVLDLKMFHRCSAAVPLPYGKPHGHYCSVHITKVRISFPVFYLHHASSSPTLTPSVRFCGTTFFVPSLKSVLVYHTWQTEPSLPPSLYSQTSFFVFHSLLILLSKPFSSHFLITVVSPPPSNTNMALWRKKKKGSRCCRRWTLII